ncbi:hypothetical protein LTSEJOH_1396, partial [Salmonella enterica subsp. enterica serovar Johannesburg str. S5-703]
FVADTMLAWKAPGAEKVLSRISPVRLNVWQGYGDCMSR